MSQEQTRKRGRKSEVILWMNEVTENFWYDLHTKHTRIVVRIQQITTLNIVLREPKSTIKIPISELDDVIVVNERSVGHGGYAGFSRGRYFTPNYGSGNYDHRLVGDLVFSHHGDRKIAFHNILDPRSVRNLVNHEKKKLQLIQNPDSIGNNASATGLSVPDAEFLMYAHDAFKMDRPSTWIIITNREASNGKVVVVFKNPPLDSIDALSVEIEQNAKTITMDDLRKLGLKSLKRNVINFQLVETTHTFDLGGQSAYKIVYDGLIHNRLVRHMRISTIKKSKLYRLEFICEAEKFFERIPTVIRMVDSFNFAADTHNNDK